MVKNQIVTNAIGDIGNEAYTLPCAEEYFEIKER